MIEDIQIRTSPEVAASPQKLRKELQKKLLPGTVIHDYRVLKRSVDARQRRVMLNLTVRVAVGDDRNVPLLWKSVKFVKVPENAPRLIIIGAGPAGLFGALEALRHGIKPIIIERGEDVDTRRLNIAHMCREKRINPRSNYCFGEGGAGAFSDGKLYTRSKKRGNVTEVLELLVQYGASEEILVDAHPHIGSDRLPHVIKNIRSTIIANGGEVHFGTVAERLLIKDTEVCGVVTDKGDVEGDAVMIATGHSAHDTFRNLHSQGVPMEAKGIAIGVRLEHPQQLIDRIQYHSKEGRGRWLPAAEYSFVTQVDGRGVYSFCMCPGGVIVPAGSSEGELVVNGMSASARAGEKANSGMVVEIHPGDFPEYAAHGPLEILALQEDLEQSIYRKAGNSIIAPAQRMTDFISGGVSATLPSTTYAPGVQSMDFNELLPPFIADRLAKGFRAFGRKAPGFLSPEGVMIGLESRTSSPVRIVRDNDTKHSIGFNNVYPVGEGAGYAGGIVSAALDGINAARAFHNNEEKCQ